MGSGKHSRVWIENVRNKSELEIDLTLQKES